jgi:hypothetical protein
MVAKLPVLAWTSLAIGGAVAHIVLFGLLHWLEPHLSPKSAIISDYAHTSSASLATSAFLAFAGIWLSLAVALAGTSPRGSALTSGRVLLVLAAVGIVTGAVLPETADPRTSSILASLQNLFARPGLFLAVILVSLGLRGASGWADLWPSLLALSLVAAATLPITIGVMLEQGYAGVGQRAIFALLYVWVVVVAMRLAKPKADSEVHPRDAVPGQGAA